VLEQRRLADAGLTQHEERPALPGSRFSKQAFDRLALSVSAHELHRRSFSVPPD
jgi:hypothetical protein